MFCPSCGSEYVEGYTHCRECDVDLVEKAPGEPDIALVKVYEAGNAAALPMIESLLTNAGIEFMTKSEPVQDLFGWGRFGSNLYLVGSPIEFFVREDLAEEARALLDTLPAPGEAARTRSGRPEPGEFADYAQEDIGHVEGDDAVEALEASSRIALQMLRSISDTRVEGLTYAPGKWTFKEVIGHLIDDERIFAYRALCVARGDARPLPGFDENEYMRGTSFEARSMESLTREYDAVRQATIAFFETLSQTEWQRRGIVNGYEASPRGLAFHIVGHELHHLRTLRERYLPLL